MASTWLDWLFHQLVIHIGFCHSIRVGILGFQLWYVMFDPQILGWLWKIGHNDLPKCSGQRMAQPPGRNGMKMVLDVLIKCTMATIIALSWEELGEHIFHHHPCVLSRWMLSVHVSVWLTLLMRCVLILFVPFDGGITSNYFVSHVWWASLCF